MKNLYLKILAVISYLCMVVVNILATSLPLNNRSTGQISDAYPNLFAPAGWTFSIWGLIYLALGGYVVYQFLKHDKKIERLISAVNPFFIISSLANSAWIFAWHYDLIGLSVGIMILLLLSLIKIAEILRPALLDTTHKLFIQTPFSIYFGWITVATIANVTVLLVSLGWNGWGIADYVWTSVILLVGAIIGIMRLHKDKNTVYGLVLIWAYLGILSKHLSVGGFNNHYPNINITLGVCLFGLSVAVIKIAYKK